MSAPAKKLRNLRRKDERPGEIIDAALQEFAANGFAATRLDAVAERAGICKGTIYLYFESKQDLFKAVIINKMIPHIEGTMDSVQDHRGSCEDLLRKLLHAGARRLIDSELVYISRLIIAEGSKFPELAEFYYREVIQRTDGYLREIIRRGIREGEFRGSALIEYTQLIQLPIISSIIWKDIFREQRDLDVENLIDTYLDLLFNGLKKR